MTPGRKTVVLADDHQLVRAGLRSLIEDFGDYQVLGEAQDGEEAIALVLRLQPDVLLLDITMPRLTGLDALPRIKQASAGTRLLIVSMYDSADFVMQALRLGADGYLLKDSAAVELQLALDAVTSGQRYLSPAVSGTVVEHALSHAADTRPAPLPPGASPLTPRQIEILTLLASGKGMKEIAYDLGLSVKTVETHRAQIMERLNIRDLPRLVLYALRQGLISPDQT
ncbi:response regulator transcription factor [Aquabacterium sp. A7-Y]|uniref:response regulator n=1 Tax=Aquabacterium sp. A7-Y TaxID=1349605 RepID=UPI00223DE366|nr:response regulator transcription factor [Aquabacterium sp. A7-Y]MCW7541095.1 response regulator transcription factor [Aquabacterium sp. A7-Y]